MGREVLCGVRKLFGRPSGRRSSPGIGASKNHSGPVDIPRARQELRGVAVESGLLCLGDSRVHHGIQADVLEEAGLGSVATLWVGGAKLFDLLRAAR